MSVTASALRLPSLCLSIMAGLALVLTGCSGRDPEPEQNIAASEPAGTTVEIPEVAEPAIPAEPPKPAVDNAVVEEEVPPEVQMQEDADATGMTSRLPPATDDQAPVVTE
jgi:hypothetical protein